MCHFASKTAKGRRKNTPRVQNLTQGNSKMESCSDNKCKSVLIVEDDESIRTILSEIIQDEGYQVFTAENGAAGLKILDSIPRPCLILLDFMMPVMNGKEFMEKKRQNDLIAAIPVVLVSAFEDRSKAIGAVGFVRKPIDFDCLMKLLTCYCNGKKNSVPDTFEDKTEESGNSFEKR